MKRSKQHKRLLFIANTGLALTIAAVAWMIGSDLRYLYEHRSELVEKIQSTIEYEKEQND